MIQAYTVLDHEEGVEILLFPSHKRMVFPGISMGQMTEGRIAYNNGALIQKAFPFLNADQREFLMSGLTPDEWNAIFA
jgi:hypothetical protein